MKGRLQFDLARGLVIGVRGRPVGKKLRNGYTQIRGHAGSHFGMAHRLIWESAHGPIPEGMQINHKNGKRSDNRICNLELVTPSENCLHAYRALGRVAFGEFNGRAKLNNADVIDIRRRAKRGESDHTLALEFKVSRGTISGIRTGRRWSHLA